MDLLESAVYRQHTALGEESKYPTLEMAAAAQFHALVHDHPFHNGNKRTALVSLLVVLDENGVMATCEEDELFQLVLRLAQHKLVDPGKNIADREVLHMAEWLQRHTRGVEKGDRSVTWRKLIQILKNYGCEAESVNAGQRLNLARVIQESRSFGRRRSHRLEVQVRCTDLGRPAPIDIVKDIRRGLRLDEEHGFDSADFYQSAGVFPSPFIVKYRRTLKRLARL